MNRPWSGGVSEAGFETLERLAKDLPVFAESCLTVRAKTGAFVPLALNPAQARLHARLEAQRAATGKVRALVLKARQQGVSTYVQARHYWRTAFGKGLQAFILAHETGASEALFAITRRMHALSPEPMRPRIGRDNPRELSFPGVGGGHGAGTAGADAVGRSKTIQLLHGSEAAFWKNAAEHFAGVVQAVPDLEGTEIIIESTANGPRGRVLRAVAAGRGGDRRLPGLLRALVLDGGVPAAGPRGVRPWTPRRPSMRRCTASIRSRWPGGGRRWRS